MSEQQQHREPRQPGALNSMLLIAGIIGGTIALVVVLLFGGLGIFHNACVFRSTRPSVWVPHADSGTDRFDREWVPESSLFRFAQGE